MTQHVRSLSPAWLRVLRFLTAAVDWRPSGSVVDKAETTQSAPTKLLVSRMLHETVQVTHHDRKSPRLRKFDYVCFDTKHTLGRPTIIVDINATHRNSPKFRHRRHTTDC